MSITQLYNVQSKLLAFYTPSELLRDANDELLNAVVAFVSRSVGSSYVDKLRKDLYNTNTFNSYREETITLIEQIIIIRRIFLFKTQLLKSFFQEVNNRIKADISQDSLIYFYGPVVKSYVHLLSDIQKQDLLQAGDDRKDLTLYVHLEEIETLKAVYENLPLVDGISPLEGTSKSLVKLLVLAAQCGELDLVKKILQDPRCSGFETDTKKAEILRTTKAEALDAAVKEGHLLVVKYFHQEGFFEEIKNIREGHSLEKCVVHAVKNNNTEMLSIFTQDPTYKFTPIHGDFSFSHSLRITLQENFVEILNLFKETGRLGKLEIKKPVVCRDINIKEALEIIIEKNNLAMFEIFCKLNFWDELPAFGDFSFYSIARQMIQKCSSPELFSLILDHTRFNNELALDDKTFLCTLLEDITKEGLSEVVKIMLEPSLYKHLAKTHISCKILCLAAEKGHKTIVSMILSSDAINSHEHQQHDCFPFSIALASAVQNNDLETVEMLIKDGRHNQENILFKCKDSELDCALYDNLFKNYSEVFIQKNCTCLGYILRFASSHNFFDIVKIVAKVDSLEEKISCADFHWAFAHFTNVKLNIEILIMLTKVAKKSNHLSMHLKLHASKLIEPMKGPEFATLRANMLE